jgi:putative ABC transport system permease protein
VPASIRSVQEIRIDGAVFAFSITLTLLSAAVFGFLPALRATRANSHIWLRGGAQELGSGRGRLRGSLVVAQVSLAVVLLVGAGLLLRSFLLMQQVDLGYRDRGVFMAGVVFPSSRYRTTTDVLGAINGTLERLRASAAVKSAEATDLPPLLGGGDQDVTAIPVGEAMTGSEPPSIWYRGVTPGYIATMHMRLLAGRQFTPADRAGAPNVAIINSEAAARYWHGNDPVGRQMSLGRDPQAPKVTIIGVVAAGKHNGPNQPTKSELFFPLEQFPARGVTFVVEPAADHRSAVAALRDALESTDPLVPAPAISDIEALVGTAVSLPRLYATLVSTFAAAALLLAVLGVYGVMAFRVAQRQREIGVRLALGAAPSRILVMVLGEGSRLAMAGVVIGFAAAVALGRTVSALLFGIEPFDLTTFMIAALVLGLMTVAAAFIPARRAMRVDPITTIRGD